MTISGVNSTTTDNLLTGIVPGTGARSTTAQAAAASASSTGSTAGTSTDESSSITSNDFLTLLVTEMKNQDPTQPTDPNAYIQQLVEVNSLQQLISINGELGSSGTSTTGSSSSGSATAAAANSALQTSAATAVI